MTTQGSNDSERALAAARARGAVDEPLLDVLRREPLVCGVDEVDGQRRPAARELGGAPAVLAWTSADRAARAGWSGALAEQPGAEIARLLAGTGLGLAINPGEELGVSLDLVGVERLAAAGAVPAGATVYLGEPAVPLEHFETELAAALSSVAGVAEARVAVLVTVQGTATTSETTVVLTLVQTSATSAREQAYAACDRAAQASGLGRIAVVVADELGGLREAALALPVAYRASPGDRRG